MPMINGCRGAPCVGAHTGMYALCVLYGTHARTPVCPLCGGFHMSVKTMMDTETITRIVVAVLATMAQPAEATEKVAVSVANKASEAKASIYGEAGFVYLSKVKLPALKKAGLVPAGMTVKQALAAGLMDNTRVDPAIATKAPKKQTVQVANVEPTKTDLKDMDRLRRKGLIA